MLSGKINENIVSPYQTCGTGTMRKTTNKTKSNSHIHGNLTNEWKQKWGKGQICSIDSARTFGNTHGGK